MNRSCPRRFRRPFSLREHTTALNHNLRRSRRHRLLLTSRPSGVPRRWREVHDGSNISEPPTIHQVEQWLMILASRNIPYLVKGRRRLRVYVPAFLEGLARSELEAVAAETHDTVSPSIPIPAHANAHWVLFLFLLLILWHGARMGWSISGILPGLPDLSPDEWLEYGAANVFRILHEHEWYRCITALTLHSDSEHVFGNVLFGAPFLILLFRRTGLGTGLLLTLLAGTLGNVLNTLYRPEGHTSFGFSTALFGSVGILSGLLALQETKDSRGTGTHFWRRALLLLAAAAAILAMIGTEGVRTDYAAHLFGLLSGFGTGVLAALLMRHFGEPSLILQLVGGILALTILIFCWSIALQAAS